MGCRGQGSKLWGQEPKVKVLDGSSTWLLKSPRILAGLRVKRKTVIVY